MGGTDPATYDTAHDEAYLRYAVARLGAYRHVWWSMANEWDLVACKGKGLPPRDDWERTKFAAASPVWDQLFATLASEDPYAHLSSIHNQYLNYDHSKPWVTHISAQGEVRYVLPPVNTNAHVGWYDVGHTKRHFPTRPIIWDEVMYEGDVPFWGGLTAAQMADRFWWGLAHGVYVGHGETLTAGGRCYDDDACVDDDDHAFWWSKGGTLRGESPSRIRWFRTLAARLFDDVSCTCSAWGGVGSAAVCDDGCARPHKPGDGVAIATDDATFFVLHAAHPYAAPPHAPADSVLELPPGEWRLQPIDIMAMRVLPPARTLRGGGGVKVRGSDLSPAALTTAAMRVPCNKWSSSTCCAAAAAACTPYVFVLTREPLAWPPPAPPPAPLAPPPPPPPLIGVAKVVATVAAVDPTGTVVGVGGGIVLVLALLCVLLCVARRYRRRPRRFERVRQGEDTGLRNGRRASKKPGRAKRAADANGRGRAMEGVKLEDFLNGGADFKFSRPGRAKRNGRG